MIENRPGLRDERLDYLPIFVCAQDVDTTLHRFQLSGFVGQRVASEPSSPNMENQHQTGSKECYLPMELLSQNATLCSAIKETYLVLRSWDEPSLRVSLHDPSTSPRGIRTDR